jgi:hypothetical protein
MKKQLYTILFSLCAALTFMPKGNAQIIHGQYTITTLNIDFSTLKIPFGGDTVIIDTTHADSSNTKLWQMGSTHKSYFADTGSAKGIMTDTLNPYPVNANSWFVLKGFINQNYINPIISFGTNTIWTPYMQEA